MSSDRDQRDVLLSGVLRDGASEIVAATGRTGDKGDTLRAVLSAVADAFATGAPDRKEALAKAAAGHAVSHFDSDRGFSPILQDLQALRRAALTHLWTAGAEQAATTAEQVRAVVERVDDLFTFATWAAADAEWEVRHRILAVLDRMAGAASEATSEDELLRRLLRLVLDGGKGVDLGAILLVDGEELVVRAAIGLEDEVAQHLRIPIGVGFSGLVAQRRAPVFLPSAVNDPLVWSPVIRAIGVQALYGVPLVHEGELLGVAHVGSFGPDLSRTVRLLLRGIADRAAASIALARHRRSEQDARRRLEVLIESLPVGIGVADETGRITALNSAVAEIWGAAPRVELPEYARYRAWRTDTGEELSSEAWALARAVSRGESTPPELLEIERFDGGRRTILNSARPVYDDGRIIGGVAVLQDVTALRRAERRQRVFAELGLLPGSLEPADWLARLAELVVPAFADRCVLYMKGEGAALERVASFPADAPDIPGVREVVADQTRPDPEGRLPRGLLLRRGASRGPGRDPRGARAGRR